MFRLNTFTADTLRSLTPNFGFSGFGEIVYYRTYSRTKLDGTQENWADTVIRVIEGVFNIRKTYLAEHFLPWHEEKMQEFASHMALSLFRLEWSPPGRGLWAMGTNLIYERGAMPLYNCAFTLIEDTEDLAWLMDLLMNGVGVGFMATRDEKFHLHDIGIDANARFVVPDTREGWVDSVRYLLSSYVDGVNCPVFDYSYIRHAGEPLKTFGGTSSGPGPLVELHNNLHALCERYIGERIDSVQFKTDAANLIGCCVVAGNVRRSAEIALGSPNDPVFMDLKDYKLYPERANYGWMSNNSVVLEHDADYDFLSDIAHRVIKNGEPGYFNKKNVKYARMGDTTYGEDKAIGLNPCAEICLENKEVCNLAITCPTRCPDEERWYLACDYATFYCSTVTLLPTHQKETNAVIARNHRIGIDILDFVGWKEQVGTQRVIKYLRTGYNRVRALNSELANEAGIPKSIRVTTIKPNGTVSKLMGRPAGHPNARYMLRRLRVQKDTPLERILKDARIPCEPCVNQPTYTTIFEFPIYNGDVREVHEVSLWEQAANLVLLQREWADNAVSNTLYFSGAEIDDVEHVLSSIVPVTKSVSMAPKDCSGHYAQMPEQQISANEFALRLDSITTIDWTSFRGDGADEKYCDTESCNI